MIFLSTTIKNKIIDECEVDEIIDKLEEFNNDNITIFTEYNYGIINIDYIRNLLEFENNKMAYYCADENFDIYKCFSCMIYSKQNKKNSDTILYYIMLICTDKNFRNKYK